MIAVLWQLRQKSQTESSLPARFGRRCSSVESRLWKVLSPFFVFSDFILSPWSFNGENRFPRSWFWKGILQQNQFLTFWSRGFWSETKITQFQASNVKCFEIFFLHMCNGAHLVRLLAFADFSWFRISRIQPPPPAPPLVLWHRKRTTGRKI